jgi:N-acetyl-1-D-myo-inositol-2-amino-2-deoxy-alpha-D-glucopyranoside deacetylase
MTDRRLLLVHAHPDDETIGNGVTMARYAGEGAQVTLVTCTRGEEGEVLVPELAHLAADADDQLGDHRETELANAMAALGVTDHRWLGGAGRYRDSGMMGLPTNQAAGCFWQADLREAADHLVEVVREVRPQVLVTYDETGGYGHPDHIQAHRVAMYAAALAAAPSYRLDLGPAWDIPKVYWTAMSQSRLRESLRQLRSLGDELSFGGMDPDGELPPFAVPDELLTTAIDAPELVERKLAAMRAYPTQITLDGPFFALSNNLGNQVWSTEYFRLVKGEPGKPSAETGLEDDLFAGVS